MQVKINIDGGSRGNPGPGASAYVICDLNGKILAQEGHFMAHCTNNQAEYTALKLALIKSKELGATELFIESDSLLLVKQFVGEYKIKNPDLAARMVVIRRLAESFSIHIKHVLREFNKAPDALANKAMDAKQSLGFNPIKHLPEDAEILAVPQTGNTVNGVEVKPVVRKPAQSAKKQHPEPPSLFGDF
ncbi:ribonuclease HI family protein [Candidatus Avelusimicrobium luingense]|uniref:ribonuclease HI family protein n=1 Tax=Candidatus Avelusimicrobium luingense TaxID=3416211 RepID=UPI003D107E82